MSGSDVPDRFSIDFTGLTLLGIYRVDTRLAEGGMGSIYVGEDTNLGRKVVIKVPHVRFLGEPGFRGRFRQEITELVRLEHPHIVRILAQGEHEDVPFFVLQFLGGGSLEDRFAAGEARSLEGWLPTIAATLDYVHARGTVHRDVKPANILFDEQGHVFLSDFGVAKALGNEEVQLTAAGTGIGSPEYMAPEQTGGDELTPAADQYALASTVYEALSGRPPYDGKSAIDMIVAKRSEDPPPLDAPRHVADAVHRGMARDPADRFESCAAFAAAVVDAPVDPGPERTRIEFTIAGWRAVVLFALLAGGAYLLFGRGGDEPPADGATNETDMVRVTLLGAGDEPRASLRRAIAPGAEESFAVRVQQRIHYAGSGRDFPPWASPPKTWRFTLRADAEGDDGSIRVAWKTDRFEFELAEETPAEARKGFEKSQESYAAFAGWTVLTPNGLAKAAGLDVPDDTPTNLRRDMSNLLWYLRAIAVPYPVEPVGVGATWEVTETVDLMGMRVTNATKVHLVRRNGDDVVLELHVAQIAARQRLEGFGDPAPTLNTLHTKGNATSRTDLRHVVPAGYDYDITLQLEMEYEEKGSTKTEEAIVRLRMEVARE